ncbi:sigma-70 family RNA polymerase sigma factor [Desulfurispira natronophila]|uniref:RNA polymerase primary sigma factor n=1 Tax=Desulfurispira natronophila TaxID=682562 RepID=A0A7W7Y4T2_9BACT|nr:RNA polymerase sigma factor RpoD/SigA [Desulfurispira natronophila]MBB5022100.1 RNA polymerase primary sigma factor [Desulfurispira natronophila]
MMSQSPSSPGNEDLQGSSPLFHQDVLKHTALGHFSASGDSLRDYLRRISKLPLLSADEEKALARRIAKGDREAYRILVESNLRFVVKVSMKYRDIGINLLDLINEGNVGLLEAARRFDPERGTRFITYAVWWIKQSIIQAIIATSNTVRLPGKQARYANKINVAKRDFARDHDGREPTEKELLDEYGLDTSNVEDILRATRSYVSLDNPIAEGDDRTLKDTLENPPEASTEEEFIRRKVAEEIREILTELEVRDATVVDMRFGITEGVPQTLEEVGTQLALSKERVRQIEERALKRLRRKALNRKLFEYLQ